MRTRALIFGVLVAAFIGGVLAYDVRHPRVAEASVVGNNTRVVTGSGGAVGASGPISITGPVSITGNLSVTGTSALSGAVTNNGGITTQGNLAVTGTSALSGAVSITGAVTMLGGLTATGTTVPGVYAVSTANNWAGVHGVCNSGSLAAGVYGESSSGYGTWGVSSASGGAGGYGLGSGSARGVVAEGDTTSPARSAFRIVPQDAEPTGPNDVGDVYVTSAGVLKICTVAGSPGTWVSVGAQ